MCVSETDSVPVHRKLQQALTAEYVHTTGLGHYHFLLWSLVTGPGGAAENPDSPYSDYGHYTALTKYHTVFDVRDPIDLS